MAPTTIPLRERMILANQYRILAALYPQQKDDYEFKAEVLENGYTNYYQQLSETFSPELPEDEAQYVFKVMGVYYDIQYSYTNQLTEAERNAIGNVAFLGFDGNNEAQYMRFARFIKENGSYQTLQCMNADMNSHMPTRTRYKAMLAKYLKMYEPREFTAAQIRELLGRTS